jgi:cytochrome c2
MRRADAMLPVIAALLLGGCDLSRPTSYETKGVQGGDPARGFALIVRGDHGCQACHAIPGIRVPKGVAGPPLAGMARRGFIAGQLPNKPGVMIAFLQNPPALVPTTGMPNVGLDLAQARDIAAFLYTLERPDAR